MDDTLTGFEATEIREQSHDVSADYVEEKKIDDGNTGDDLGCKCYDYERGNMVDEFDHAALLTLKEVK